MSKHILRNTQGCTDFVARLKTVHEVQDELPANQYTRQEIDRRFAEATKKGRLNGYQTGFDKGKQDGYQEGFEAGRTEAHAEVEAEYQSQIQAFAADLDRLQTEAQASLEFWFQQAEKRLSLLALEIARRAIGNDETIQEQAVIDLARQVMREATDGTAFRIRVNAAVSPAVEARKQQILDAVPHARDIEVIADSTVTQGCIVETSSATIDARVESYLSRLADTIQGEAA